MKSDQEFLEGIYQKAEMRKQEEDCRNIEASSKKGVFGFSMAIQFAGAFALVALLGIGVGFGGIFGNGTAPLDDVRYGQSQGLEIRKLETEAVTLSLTIRSADPCEEGYVLLAEVQGKWDGDRHIRIFCRKQPDVLEGETVFLSVIRSEEGWYLNEE